LNCFEHICYELACGVLTCYTAGLVHVFYCFAYSDDALDEQLNDLDNRWQKYWADYGEQLIWDSWKTKYSDYIDPSYAVTAMDKKNATEEEIVETPNKDDDPTLAKDDVTGENVSDAAAVDETAIEEPQHDDTEFSNDVKADDTWDKLWEQHRNETYWYYYDWFKHWMDNSSQLDEAGTGDTVETAAEKTSSGLEDSSFCETKTVPNRSHEEEGRNAAEALSLGAEADHVCCEFTSLRVASGDEPVDGKSSRKQKKRRDAGDKQGSYSYRFIAAKCRVEVQPTPN
jgi:hypothetical protein